MPFRKPYSEPLRIQPLTGWKRTTAQFISTCATGADYILDVKASTVVERPDLSARIANRFTKEVDHVRQEARGE